MIRTLVAHRRALDRGALAFVLRAEDDIEVVAELDRIEDVTAASESGRADVAVVDLELFGPDGPAAAGGVLSLPEGHRTLLLTDVRHARALAPIIARRPSGIGFLTKNASPDRLVACVRRVAADEVVIDAELVVAATEVRSPLTPRETEVLAVAASGGPVTEIAARLSLAPGTVRNHLSRVIAKTGGRTRIEALRIAQEAGWV